MKHAIVVALIGAMLLVFVSPADAKKPAGNGNGNGSSNDNDNGIPFGNGFPSGEHYNLNIIAKKDTFNCPEAKFDPCDPNQQIYGNVIFIPRVQGQLRYSWNREKRDRKVLRA